MKSVIALSLILLATTAQAGFLRMASSSEVSLQRIKGEIWLKGKYSIENQGDETAKDVFPAFHLDGWKKEYEKRTLPAGEKTTWQVNERIPNNQLCKSFGEQCVLVLPDQGDFFIRVEKNYQDQNSYPFSAPEILSLSIDKKSSLKSARDLISATIKVKMIGTNEFQGDYTIKNKTSKPHKLGLHLLFPKEISLQTPRLPLDLNASGELNGTFYFKNTSGLHGSDYLAMMVIETVSDGERIFLWEPTRFKIENFRPPVFQALTSKFSIEQWFFYGMGALSVVALIAMLLWWELPRRKVE